MKSADRQSRTVANVKSALIAGVVAFVVYFVITTLIAGYNGNVLLMSLTIGASTFVVAWLVTTLIAAAQRRRR